MQEGLSYDTSLQHECSRLMLMQDQLENLHSGAADGWKLDFVRLRRDIVIQLGRVSELIHDPKSAAPSIPSYPLLRKTFSEMRATLALHHASWPVVAIEQNNDEYCQSVAKVRHTRALFRSAQDNFFRDLDRRGT